MAISIGATITNAITTNSSTLNSNHTCDSNTEALVVVIKGYDSSDSDSVVTSLEYDSNPLSEAEYYRDTGAGDDAFVAVYYLSSPTTGSSLALELTMQGTCTDLSWDAVNLVSDAGADDIVLDSTDTGSTSTTNSHTSTVDPAATGSMAVGGCVHNDKATDDLSVSTGTEITNSEVDFGNQVASAAYVAEGSSVTTMVWAKTTTNDSWACSASFVEQAAAARRVFVTHQ